MKAFKRLHKLNDQSEVFVNPGVHLKKITQEQLENLLHAEYVLIQSHSPPQFSVFEKFLNALPVDSSEVRIDGVFMDATIKLKGATFECNVDSLEQAITIINFRKDEISNAG